MILYHPLVSKLSVALRHTRGGAGAVGAFGADAERVGRAGLEAVDINRAFGDAHGRNVGESDSTIRRIVERETGHSAIGWNPIDLRFRCRRSHERGESYWDRGNVRTIGGADAIQSAEPDDLIGTLLAKKAVRARSAEDRVVTGAAEDYIVAGTRIEQINTPPPVTLSLPLWPLSQSFPPRRRAAFCDPPCTRSRPAPPWYKSLPAPRYA